MEKCKVCNKEYQIKKRNKCHLKGFCSYNCYRTTDDFKIKFKKSFIKKRKKDINVDNIDVKKINEIFHKLKSESVKKSQEKRISTILSKGKKEFSRMTKLGSLNRKKKFLIDNKIVDECGNLSQEEIDNLYILHFNKIEKHGEKVKNGIYKKYGKNVSKEFKRRYKKAFLNFLNNNSIDISDLSIEDYKKEIETFNKKHSHNNTLQWKKTHLKNHLKMKDEDINELSEKEINKKYSQYLCDRMKLVDNIYNGYRRTKKGYYIFKNLNKKIFYRSSWEELFLKEIDKLIGKNIIDNICTPDYINYKYNNLIRKYYPDFKILFKDKYRVIEIKPFSKKKDDINKAKFKSARKILKENFIVLTEKEIFSDLKSEILKVIKDM